MIGKISRLHLPTTETPYQKNGLVEVRNKEQLEIHIVHSKTAAREVLTKQGSETEKMHLDLLNSDIKNCALQETASMQTIIIEGTAASSLSYFVNLAFPYKIENDGNLQGHLLNYLVPERYICFAMAQKNQQDGLICLADKNGYQIFICYSKQQATEIVKKHAHCHSSMTRAEQEKSIKKSSFPLHSQRPMIAVNDYVAWLCASSYEQSKTKAAYKKTLN